MIDLLFEFPNRTVLRVADPDNSVTFIERHDEDAQGGAQRWFLPMVPEGLTWAQVTQRLQVAQRWAPVTPSLKVLEVMTGLRGDFHARLAEARLAESEPERQRLVQVAMAAELAAARLAVAAGLPPVNWSLNETGWEQPTEVLQAVTCEPTVEPAAAVSGAPVWGRQPGRPGWGQVWRMALAALGVPAGKGEPVLAGTE